MGNTGLTLSVLGLGSYLTFGKQVDDKTATTMMHYAFDQGINFFDNAEFYELGKSELVMGTILKKAGWDRSEFVLASKVYHGFRATNKPNQTGLNRKHLIEGCHACLQRLQVDYLDILFCHAPDPTTPIEEVVWTMNMLIQRGKILYWGTSKWSAAEIMEAHRVANQERLIPPVVEQSRYSLLERAKIEKEYFDIYRTVGMGITSFGCLGSGYLTGKYTFGQQANGRLSLPQFEKKRQDMFNDQNNRKIKMLNDLAKDLGISLSQLSVAWSVKNERVTTTILGASTMNQLEENITAIQSLDKLTPSIMTQIDSIVS